MRTADILIRVNPELRKEAEAFIARRAESSMPFAVSALLFVGALACAALLTWALDGIFPAPLWVRGAVFAVTGYSMGRAGDRAGGMRGGVWRHCGGVFAAAGQLMVLFGLVRLGIDAWQSALAVAAVSYPLFRNSFNRFFFCAAALCCLYAQADWRWDWTEAQIALSALAAFVCAWAVFLKRRFDFYPLAYALVWWCVICAGETMDADGWLDGLSIVNMALAALAGGYAAYLQRAHWSRRAGFTALSAAAVALLLNWPTVMALGLTYAGFHLRDRVLEYAGLAGTIAGLTLFYYSLNVSLTAKSGLLVLAGVLLLALRRAYEK